MDGILFMPKVSRNGTEEQTIEIFIPSEILWMICLTLEKCDWKSLRLVSRAFKGWSNCLPLITQLWFNLQPQDLTEFKAVCATPSLAQHVTTIIIDTTDYGTGAKVTTYLGRRVTKMRVVEKFVSIRSPSSCGLLKDLDFLDDAVNPRRCDQVVVLSRGMRMLPKLRTISMASVFRPYRLNERTPKDEWCISSFPNSKFAHSFKKALDRVFAELLDEPRSLSKRLSKIYRVAYEAQWGACVLRTVISAIVKSGVEIKELHSDLDKPRTSGRYNFPAFWALGELGGKTAFVLRRLTSLSISYAYQPRWDPKYHPSAFFPQILHCAEALETFRLFVSNHFDKEAGDQLQDTLGDIRFPQLKHLHLKQVRTSISTITAVLERHKNTLKVLELDEIVCLGSDDKPDDNWGSLLDFLKDKMKLSELYLRNLIFDYGISSPSSLFIDPFNEEYQYIALWDSVPGDQQEEEKMCQE